MAAEFKHNILMKEPKPTFLGGLSVALLERLQVLGRDSFLGSIQLFSAVRQFSFKLRDAGFQPCNSQIKTAILSSRGELADQSININLRQIQTKEEELP